MTLDHLAEREAATFSVEPFSIETEIPNDVDSYLIAKALDPDKFAFALTYSAPRIVVTIQGDRS